MTRELLKTVAEVTKTSEFPNSGESGHRNWSPERPSSESGKYCTFFVEDHYFGLDVGTVQELIQAQPIRPIPQAPTVIRGLINLRGQIITAYDLRRALGFPEVEDISRSVNVIACNKDQKVSLLVDRFDEVVELSIRDCQPPPDLAASSFNRMIEAVYKMEGRLLLILEIGKIVELEPAAESGNDPSASGLPEFRNQTNEPRISITTH